MLTGTCDYPRRLVVVVVGVASACALGLPVIAAHAAGGSYRSGSSA